MHYLCVFVRLTYRAPHLAHPRYSEPEAEIGLYPRETDTDIAIPPVTIDTKHWVPPPDKRQRSRVVKLWPINIWWNPRFLAEKGSEFALTITVQTYRKGEAVARLPSYSEEIRSASNHRGDTCA